MAGAKSPSPETTTAMSMCGGHAHHVHHELDVQVRLDAPVTVLADVLAHDLVAAAAQEGVELALVLVLGIQPGVGVRADEDRVRLSMP